ncbi:MAG: RICIN domain-containing protein [Eggerthellales bacterium]|nr:RICIN domain-containing protein [Eggerthellales bacterium]
MTVFSYSLSAHRLMKNAGWLLFGITAAVALQICLSFSNVAYADEIIPNEALPDASLENPLMGDRETLPLTEPEPDPSDSDPSELDPPFEYTTIEEGIYTIESEYGTVLDVAGAGTDDFTNIQAYEGNGTGAQRFQVSSNGADENGNTYYTFTAVDAQKALDVFAAGKEDGANVDIYEANGTAAQNWLLVPSTTASGKSCYKIISAVSGKALDVDGSDSGANVRIWTPSKSASQNWLFSLVPGLTYTTIEDGTYVITSELGTVLDVEAAGSEDFTNIQTYEGNGTGAQRFNITAAGTDASGNTYYTIIAADAQKALDVFAAGRRDNTNVGIYEPNGTPAQQWLIAPSLTADGRPCYKIVSAASGKALDTEGNELGANVRIWAVNPTASQNWLFSLVPGLTYTTIEDGTYVITSEYGTVLDIEAAGTENLTNVQVYETNGTGAQRFHIAAEGVDSDGNTYYSITAAIAKKALDVYAQGRRDGTNVIIYENNNTVAQRWYVALSATADGKTCYMFISAVAGKALDAAGEEMGSNVRTWAINNTAAQHWLLTPCLPSIADGAYIISSSVDGNYVVDIADESGNDMVNAQIGAIDGSLSQAFAFTYDSFTGYYTITNYGSGRVLDVEAASGAPQANIWQYAPNGTSAQQWTVLANSNGTITIASALSNYVFDIASGKVLPGANLMVDVARSSATQQFKLIPTVPQAITGTVRIQNGSNPDLVMDVYAGSTASGTELQLYTANSTFAQTFVIEEDGAGALTIRPVVSGLYVSAANDGSVTQQALDGSYLQKWTIVPTQDGHFAILTADTLLSLGAKASSEGGLLYAAAHAANGQWNIVTVPLLQTGIYNIKLAEDSSVSVSVTNNAVYAGANVELDSTDTSNHEKFYIVYNGDDSYSVYGAWSTLALDILGGVATDGATIYQNDRSDSASQKWVITWNDGAFIFKSALGDFNMSAAAASAGANIALATADNASSAQRFLLNQTKMQRGSISDVITVLDEFAVGNSLITFKTFNELSSSSLDTLWTAMYDFWDIGKSVGFTVIDLDSGAGITFNSDTVYYSACSIKGPYSIALAEYEPSALWAYENSFWHALDYSNNETYKTYFYKYGTWPLDNYNSIGHVEHFSWTNWTGYYTAEDLCRMWVVAQDFLLGDTDEAEWLRDVLGNNTAELMRGPATYWDWGPTYAKSGWTDYTRTEGSLVMAGDHTFAVGIMTNLDSYHDTLIYHLTYALCKCMEDLIY